MTFLCLNVCWSSPLIKLRFPRCSPIMTLQIFCRRLPEQMSSSLASPFLMCLPFLFLRQWRGGGRVSFFQFQPPAFSYKEISTSITSKACNCTSVNYAQTNTKECEVQTLSKVQKALGPFHLLRPLAKKWGKNHCLYFMYPILVYPSVGCQMGRTLFNFI